MRQVEIRKAKLREKHERLEAKVASLKKKYGEAKNELACCTKQLARVLGPRDEAAEEEITEDVDEDAEWQVIRTHMPEDLACPEQWFG